MRKLSKLSLIITFLFLALGVFPLPSPQGLPSGLSLPLSQGLRVVSTLMFPAIVEAATAGSCVHTKAELIPAGVVPGSTREIILTCTGSSDAGTWPAISFDAADLAFIKGYYLYKVIAKPTTLTSLWDFTLVDNDGIDLLGSGGVDMHATNPAMIAPKLNSTTYFAHPVLGSLTLNITGNSVVSGVVVFRFVFVR
jgi:hypothetical protein